MHVACTEESSSPGACSVGIGHSEMYLALQTVKTLISSLFMYRSFLSIYYVLSLFSTPGAQEGSKQSTACCPLTLVGTTLTG
jgi:hypothetical protein